MGDMLLTSDQMKMFSNELDTFRAYHTEWLWNVKENWSATENKYLIPYTDHPVSEAQEGFHLFSD